MWQWSKIRATEKENGVFVDLQWEENCELGSTGDPIINPK